MKLMTLVLYSKQRCVQVKLIVRIQRLTINHLQSTYNRLKIGFESGKYNMVFSKSKGGRPGGGGKDKRGGIIPQITKWSSINDVTQIWTILD